MQNYTHLLRFNMCNSLSQYLSAIDSIVSHLLLYYLEAITVEWKEKNIANQEKVLISNIIFLSQMTFFRSN